LVAEWKMVQHRKYSYVSLNTDKEICPGMNRERLTGMILPTIDIPNHV
jgi:hypothetical protein